MADIVWVRICDSCQCPAPLGRDDCAFCGSSLVRPEPVSFSLLRIDGTYGWYAEGVLVASAREINGLWELADARGAQVARLVPLADHDGTIALVGPHGRLIGSIRPDDDSPDSRTGAALACDPDGLPVLILRTDGGQGAHLVDRRGDVVAIASWEHPDAATDLLVTAIGTRHSLAMVFGLLLSLEVSRHAGRFA